MKTAKTRESLRSIKVVDKTEGLAKKSKNGASSLANSAEETQNSRHETEVEYAGNEVQDKEERSGRALVRGAARVGQWGYRTTVRNIQRWRNRPRKIKLKVDAPKELPGVACTGSTLSIPPNPFQLSSAILLSGLSTIHASL